MNVTITLESPACRTEAVTLFRDVFTESEGKEEGEVIAALVDDLMQTTEPDELVVVTARQEPALAGCILFTRLRYDADTRVVFLLSPVAVSTDLHGQGVGQRLIRFGLNGLKQKGVDVVVTYGDPGFYGKVGFRSVTTDQVPAPHHLQQPRGWVAQSLTGEAFAPLKGKARAVQAFDNPDVW